MTKQRSATEHIEWIDSDASLQDFVSFATGHESYYLDTEFHRERTYYPRIALVQIRVGDRLAVIDRLSVDIALITPLLQSSSLAVLHAAQQDLDVLSHACGAGPRRRRSHGGSDSRRRARRRLPR